MSRHMAEPILAIDAVSKTYPGDGGAVQVLRDIDLVLARGETLALTGESGSGKSTLMHLAAGLDRPDVGRIAIDGTDIAGLGDSALADMRRLSIGLVFQQFNLVPSLTVVRNVTLQARLAGREDAEHARRLMDRLGIAELANRYPEQLSGGQQQRVAIARALAAKPPLILADEPTGNLDEATGDAVLSLFLELVSETGAGLLMVTHSERLAKRLDRRVHLSRGQLRDAGEDAAR